MNSSSTAAAWIAPAIRPSFSMPEASPSRISRRQGITACQPGSPHLRKMPHRPKMYSTVVTS